MKESKFEPHLVRDLGDGGFELHDFATGIGMIHLPPNEILRFEVEFTPVERVKDFVVRVVQYSEVDGDEKIVDGQTFVFGKVEGYPTR